MGNLLYTANVTLYSFYAAINYIQRRIQQVKKNLFSAFLYLLDEYLYFLEQ